MSKKHILVVGSSNTDMIIKMARLPRPGETVLGGDFLTAAGGKGANQAVGAARAGGRVTFLARVGRDALGEQAVAGWAAEGIDVKYILRDPAKPSGVALIFVGENGQNSIAVASGANARLSPADVERAAPAFASAQVVVLQLETPLATVLAAAAAARRAGVPVILNPAPAQRLSARLLRLVTILTPNETEAEYLTGVRVNSVASAARAAAELRRRGARTVIVTLGARGALLVDDQGVRAVSGYKVKALDTTAAGDIFNGALAVALAEQKPIPSAVEFANAAAALSVTRLGAQPSAPRRREIDRWLAQTS
ncbi:MAG TPA: ribokinase [Verrucomicrobiae bacterium]|jgi:ribokinase|nr:ribokinase [Verrucomicrobiae bacterium]